MGLGGGGLGGGRLKTLLNTLELFIETFEDSQGFGQSQTFDEAKLDIEDIDAEEFDGGWS